MRRRSGFTLVEVLVAMALILFIMTILAAAFGAATQIFTGLKSAGDLAEKLRGAATVLKRDLEADHFTDDPQSSPRLSSLWNTAANPNPPPPAVGLFRIYEGQADVQEGGAGVTDLDGIPSFYQTTTALHYTIALHGNRRHDFLSALVPAGSPLTTPQAPASPSDLLLGPADERYQDTPNVYNSQYAEVAVFLVPNGDQTDGATGPAQPLFGLYRRQFLTVPTDWTPPPPAGNPPAPPATQAPSYVEVSTIPTAGEIPAAANLSFNSMADLTMPVKRFWMDRNNLAGVYTTAVTQPLNPPPPPSRYATMGESNSAFKAADLLMPDVVSFDVRVLVQGGSDFEDLYQLTNPGRTDPSTGLQWYFPFNNPSITDPATGQPVRAFDTWSAAVDPNNPVYDYSKWMTPGTAASIPIYMDNKNVPISIKAIQITLRVWDFKTKKTRQVTIVQQM